MRSLALIKPRQRDESERDEDLRMRLMQRAHKHSHSLTTDTHTRTHHWHTHTLTNTLTHSPLTHTHTLTNTLTHSPLTYTHTHTHKYTDVFFYPIGVMVCILYKLHVLSSYSGTLKSVPLLQCISDPNQTHLSMLISVFKIIRQSQVVSLIRS